MALRFSLLSVSVAGACTGAADSNRLAPPPGDTDDACVTCHDDITMAWRGSRHGLAESELLPDDPWWRDPPLSSVPVRRIGIDPLIQYLIPGENGALQVSQTAWDPHAGEWFDVFDDDRGEGEWGHWTGRGMTWNSQCAACHSTGVRKGYAPESRAYHTTADAHDVGCVSCHGAQGLRPLSEVASVETCAPCHARRGELTGAWEPGDRFLDHFAPSGIDLTDVYFADGRVRDEAFEHSAFRASSMFDAGVRCVDCHDPHTTELRRAGDETCLPCHAELRTSPHDKHGALADIGCIDCHMPTTTYMQRDVRHDHSFSIPDPARSHAIDAPDVCMSCHAFSPDASREAFARLWGAYEGTRTALASSLHAAREGRDVDPGPLLTALRGDPSPAFRAAAAAGLTPLVDTRPDVRKALVLAVSDADPYVRFAALDALRGAVGVDDVDAAILRALDDDVRAVRIQAFGALPPGTAPSTAVAAEYRSYLVHNLDQPNTRVEAGIRAMASAHLPEAIAHLQHAVELDRDRVDAWRALSVAFARAGDHEHARDAAREVVRVAPDDATGWFQLGLAESGLQAWGPAVDAFARATAQDPGFVRAWTHRGLAEQRRGHTVDAVAALRKAVALAPNDEQALYALAHTLFVSGRRDEAHAAAQTLLTRHPHHRGAQELLRAR